MRIQFIPNIAAICGPGIYICPKWSNHIESRVGKRVSGESRVRLRERNVSVVIDVQAVVGSAVKAKDKWQ